MRELGTGLALAVLVTAGIAVADDDRPPATAPGPAAPRKLTLTDAVTRAVAQNPQVALAVSQIERAGALVQQARAGWLPTLAANGLLNQLDADRVFNDRVVAAANQMSGNFTLTVPLMSAPAWAATRRARSGVRIAEASAADVRRMVAQATARAYITVVAQHRLVAASETARETAKAHYEFARARLAGGVGHSIDEVRAQQDLASIEIQLQANLVALARAREALGILLASPGPIDASDDVALAPVPSMAEAMESARAKRTDLRLLDVRVTSSKNAADDVWSYYMPYLAAIGQPFVQHPPTLLQPTTGWQAQLVLTLPIYDGGLRGGITRERNAALAEARTNLDAGLRQAHAELRLGFEAMLRADQALAAAREAARLAHRAYDLATTAYRAGATTNLEVIDAARRARDADTATAQAEDAARQARLDLLVASGRFP
jgi:outer membrane protein TolC